MSGVAMTKKERRAKIAISEDYCKGCGLCVTACPQHIIAMSEQVSKRGYYPAECIDPEGKCTGCALCATMCPDAAIEVFKAKKDVGGNK